MTNIAVTGSEGFIGRHVINYRGVYGAWGIDRTCPVSATHLDDPMATLDLFRKTGPVDAVIHCAAHADVRNNWHHVAEVARDNVTATLNLLEACRLAPTVKTFVFISTGAVYANSSGDVTEATPCVATSPYAASKLAGEAYVQAYAEKCGWRWFIVRPAACFGSGYTHGHVADFVRQAKETGRIRALDNGMNPRPALHVEDLAEILISLATGEHPSGIYNVSGGTWTWRRTVELMGVPFEFDQKPNGWVGDSKGATWGWAKLDALGLGPKRHVSAGVRDALKGLGWSK